MKVTMVRIGGMTFELNPWPVPDFAAIDQEHDRIGTLILEENGMRTVEVYEVYSSDTSLPTRRTETAFIPPPEPADSGWFWATEPKPLTWTEGATYTKGDGPDPEVIPCKRVWHSEYVKLPDGRTTRWWIGESTAAARCFVVGRPSFATTHTNTLAGAQYRAAILARAARTRRS